MYADCLYDWDQLAAVWDLFEDKGLNPGVVQADLDLLTAPLGLVGCGRGKVLHHLQQALGTHQVTGYDTSAAMVAAARARGCHRVHCVAPEAGLPDGEPARSLIVATGVLDPLEPHEGAQLLRRLLPHLHAEGSLWLYAFGRFGGSWEFAGKLKATNEHGVANQILFRFYEHASSDGVDAAAERRGLHGRDKLQAKVWLHGIGKLVDAVARHHRVDAAQAMAVARRIMPHTVRHFSEDDMQRLVQAGGLEVISARRFESHGVLRVIARRQKARELSAVL